MLEAHVLFGHEVGITDVVVIFAAITYVVSVMKDWRPIRTLRRENADLRSMLTELERKYEDLSKRYELLEKTRDFQASLAPVATLVEHGLTVSTEERKRIMDAIEQHEQRETKAWREITAGLGANTRVLEHLAAGLEGRNGHG